MADAEIDHRRRGWMGKALFQESHLQTKRNLVHDQANLSCIDIGERISVITF
jgi:hypothetical protein